MSQKAPSCLLTSESSPKPLPHPPRLSPSPLIPASTSLSLFCSQDLLRLSLPVQGPCGECAGITPHPHEPAPPPPPSPTSFLHRGFASNVCTWPQGLARIPLSSVPEAWECCSSWSLPSRLRSLHLPPGMLCAPHPSSTPVSSPSQALGPSPGLSFVLAGLPAAVCHECPFVLRAAGPRGASAAG